MIKKAFTFLLALLVVGNITTINASYEEPVSLTESSEYLGSVEFDINESGTKTFISTDGELIEVSCEEGYSTFSNAGLTVTNKKYTIKKGAVSFSFQISTRANQYDEETWYTRFTDVEALSISGVQVTTQSLGESILTERETATAPARAEAYGKYTVTGLGMSTIGCIIKIKNAKVTLETYGS